MDPMICPQPRQHLNLIRSTKRLTGITEAAVQATSSVPTHLNQQQIRLKSKTKQKKVRPEYNTHSMSPCRNQSMVAGVTTQTTAESVSLCSSRYWQQDTNDSLGCCCCSNTASQRTKRITLTITTSLHCIIFTQSRIHFVHWVLCSV